MSNADQMHWDKKEQPVKIVTNETKHFIFFKVFKID